MFTLLESQIFFSCETCFRGALLIKSKNSNDKFENNFNEQKIWGIINIVSFILVQIYMDFLKIEMII